MLCVMPDVRSSGNPSTFYPSAIPSNTTIDRKELGQPWNRWKTSLLCKDIYTHRIYNIRLPKRGQHTIIAPPPSDCLAATTLKTHSPSFQISHFWKKKSKFWKNIGCNLLLLLLHSQPNAVLKLRSGHPIQSLWYSDLHHAKLSLCKTTKTAGKQMTSTGLSFRSDSMPPPPPQTTYFFKILIREKI